MLFDLTFYLNEGDLKMKNCKKMFTFCVSLAAIHVGLPMSAAKPAEIKSPGMKKLAAKYFNADTFNDGHIASVLNVGPNAFTQNIEQAQKVFLSGYTTPNKTKDALLAKNLIDSLKELLTIKGQGQLFIKFNKDPEDPKQILVNNALTQINSSLEHHKDILTRFIPKILYLDEPPFPLLETAIAAGANINDETAPYLIKAIANRTPSSALLTKFLLTHGANPNIQYYGHTPLMTAAEQGNLQAVYELLEAGANPNVVNPESGRTPLIDLMKFIRIDDEDVSEEPNSIKIAILRLFLRHNVNVQATDKRNKTALHYATRAVRQILTGNQPIDEAEAAQEPFTGFAE